MRKLFWWLVLCWALASGGAHAAYAQVLLPSTLNQYPPPGTLTTTDCLLGVQPQTQPAHPPRCFSLSALAAFIQSGGSGIGINAGLANQPAYYATDGLAISPVATAPVNNAVFITGGTGIPAEATTLPVNLSIPSAIVTPQKVTQSTLPSVTAADEGQWAEVSDCANGTETGPGVTGCWARVNNLGAWVLQPNPTTAIVAIAGQNMNLVNGASVAGAGNGNKIMTTDGSGINGHVPQFDAGGKLIDSGVGPGGGGGAGTVSAALANQIGYYAANGTTISGLAVTNNAVLITSGAGVPSESTTLPANLTIPTPTISSPNVTGTATISAITMSGKFTAAASAVGGSGVNLPPGVAPTTPANGDFWTTSSAGFLRINGVTGGIATTVNGGALSGTGGVAVSNAGVISCTTCALLPTGGTLTASAPMSVSATGALTVGTAGANEITRSTTYYFDPLTTVANGTYTVALKYPYTSGHITKVDWKTGGTGTPTFTLAVNVNGVAVTGCNAITVNATGGTTTCTSTAITAGQPLTITISGVGGTPVDASIEIGGTSTIL